VLTLGEDRALVAVDLLNRPACAGGSFVGRGTGPDQGLDIARPEPAVDLDLQLPQAWPIAPDGGT